MLCDQQQLLPFTETESFNTEMNWQNVICIHVLASLVLSNPAELVRCYREEDIYFQLSQKAEGGIPKYVRWSPGKRSHKETVYIPLLPQHMVEVTLVLSYWETGDRNKEQN